MKWTKPRLLEELKRLGKAGTDLSYNALARKKQSLVSAAAYHFGSYRKAVERAGLDYADVTRRPRWTRQAVIGVIKQAKRDGRDLHWSAVTKKKDELARAAFAALQPRLFGRWDRALHAAGLDADDVSRYRAWDRNEIVFELKARWRDSDALNSGAVQREDPALHAASLRHFGSYEAALRAAGLDPSKVRRRRNWNKESVVKALRMLKRKRVPLTDSALRREDPALHGAAVRLFGSFTAARAAVR